MSKLIEDLRAAREAVSDYDNPQHSGKWPRASERAVALLRDHGEALERLVEESQWRPIDSAPRKLGEFVDLWVVWRLIVTGEVHTQEQARYANARWVDWQPGTGHWIDVGGNSIEYRASEKDGHDSIVNERVVTHWMPTPTPPKDT